MTTTKEERRRRAAEILRNAAGAETRKPARRSTLAERQALARRLGVKPAAVRRGLDSPGMVRWRADRGLTREDHKRMLEASGMLPKVLTRDGGPGATVTVLRPKPTPGTPGVLAGYGVRFNQWATISSVYEGTFLERISRGAFRDTITGRLSEIRTQFDHGRHPLIGSLPIGRLTSLVEDDDGLRYEIELSDSAMNRDFLAPALRTGQMGSSFRFEATAETWHEPTRASRQNPKKLPERTLHAVSLYELGPVVWPAYNNTTPELGE